VERDEGDLGRESVVVLRLSAGLLGLRHIRLCAGEVGVDELTCGAECAPWLAEALARSAALVDCPEARATLPPDTLIVSAEVTEAGPRVILRNVRDDDAQDSGLRRLSLSQSAAQDLAWQLGGL
jgi:hypothetical protein